MSYWDKVKLNNEEDKNKKLTDKKSDELDDLDNDQFSLNDNEDEVEEVSSDEDVPLGLDYDELEDEGAKKNWKDRFKDRFLISPNNRKLKNFHILVSISYYFDFLWICFCIGNYDF